MSTDGVASYGALGHVPPTPQLFFSGHFRDAHSLTLVSIALYTLATIVAENGDYSRQCGQGFTMLHVHYKCDTLFCLYSWFDDNEHIYDTLI